MYFRERVLIYTVDLCGSARQSQYGTTLPSAAVCDGLAVTDVSGERSTSGMEQAVRNSVQHKVRLTCIYNHMHYLDVEPACSVRGLRHEEVPVLTYLWLQSTASVKCMYIRM